MLRVFLAMLGLGVVLLLSGFLYLGLNPPRPHPRQMQITIPNAHLAGG